MTANQLLLLRLAVIMIAQAQQIIANDELFDHEEIGNYEKSMQISKIR
jgi:hypothetical protein